jgi:ribosomal-protein-alanine N-acetyltransferase
MKEYQDGQDGPWGIEYRDTGRVIGHVHLMAIDAYHQKAQVGFVSSKAFRSTGLIPEAVRKVFSYSFDTIGLNRLEGLCLVEDQWARSVIEEVGMVREGLLRDFNFQKGAFRDFVMYALLKREFFTKEFVHFPIKLSSGSNPKFRLPTIVCQMHF